MPARKTNAVRLLETAGVEFTLHEYEVDEGRMDAVSVAGLVGADPERVFKTLVTETDSGENAVFCIPGNCELDLKKAAAAAGAKRVALVPRDSLSGLTGYIHGGCSPVGMRKAFPTWIDETAELHETILVSAGVRGQQIEIDPAALAELVGARFADVAG